MHVRDKAYPRWCLATLLALCVAFPWVHPFSWGPNPDMMQRLIAGACASGFLLLWAIGGPWLSLHQLVRTVAVAWLVAALLSSIMALLQYFGAVEGGLTEWITRTTAGNAFANLRQRNQFASLTSIGLLSLLFMAQWPTKRDLHPAHRLRQWLIAVGVLLLAAGNAASSSRTGAVQWLLIAGLALVWETHGQRPLLRWSVLALGLILAANIVLPLLLHMQTGVVPVNALDRFGEDAGSQSRTVLWANVLELIREKPWLGWGWGELKFAHFMQPYAGERFNDILDNAHNLPLHLAVTLGVPAAVMLCGTALVLTLRARPWREASATRQLAWGVLLVLAVHSLLEYPLWYAPFQVAAVLAVGMLCGRRLLRWSVLPVLASGMAGLLITATAYTGWDYWRVSQLYMPPALRADMWREDTLNKVRDSVIFRGEVQFAYVTTTPVTSETAEALYAASLQTLHFSPEPKVIAVLLESAALLNMESPLTEHIRRQWRAAYREGY
ncbi:PglL family O-oligosaccharyltransferase [Rhodoferax mekongensis]|uniref:Wzy polymerase domain-containing protein n=1 Tax=Rhodoferax mekongensis TaxID=3068341 RepID=A0ABZ0B0Y6_9BURK|nr:Wzy polymerase domain-containing protein [Rhodoferax sp. TBRC 17307]WNO05501.1 Wzy polymerase domain-containing protein [Rhodoferax sp. TBRC 17307]